MSFSSKGQPAVPIVARAPVRVSFGGGGTDLAAYYEPHGGLVVSTAVTRYAYAMARPSADGGIHLNSADYRVSQSFPRGRTPPVRDPLRLVKAVVEWFGAEELLPHGVSLFMASEVASGSGLGGSSAMAVALITALAAYTGLELDRRATAELACRIEIDRLEMPIGKQDQYASAYGGLNVIRFHKSGVSVRPLGLPASTRHALAMRLLLFDTGQTHDSADILYQQREDSRSRPVTVHRLHRLKAAGEEMSAALRAGDLDRFGKLLHRSWEVKRQLSHKISTAAIDEWYAAAREAGALGGKVTGAGGGGYLLLYCPLHRQRAIRQQLCSMGLRETPFGIDETGPQLFRPAELPAESRWQTAVGRESEMMDSDIERYWRELAAIAQSMPFRHLDQAAELLIDCYRAGGTVFVLGNGGSAATASHFACDLAKGTRTNGQPTFRVMPLTDNVPLVTAWANDTSYERVFAEQLAAFVHPGDVVVAISTSGNSPNVLAAAEVARQSGATTIAMTGDQDCQLHDLADLAIRVPHGSIEQVEDAHLAAAHSLCVALRERIREEQVLPYRSNGASR